LIVGEVDVNVVVLAIDRLFNKGLFELARTTTFTSTSPTINSTAAVEEDFSERSATKAQNAILGHWDILGLRSTATNSALWAFELHASQAIDMLA
jgi:hypothetical protein